MSLSQSRALNGVHPWLAERIRFMDLVIDFWGGKQGYLSGVRSEAEQRHLYETVVGRPVAYPGCGQHQYGFAVDVFWLPIMNFQTNIAMGAQETREIMESLAQQIGLVTVRGDSGHFQVFPGTTFKAWAVASGFCDPNPPPPGPPDVLPSFLHPDGGVVTRADGSKTWVWNTTR